jgi:hypothetical protein
MSERFWLRQAHSRARVPSRAALALFVVAAVAISADKAGAFGIERGPLGLPGGPPGHPTITRVGLAGPGGATSGDAFLAKRSFLRRAVLDDINDQHAYQDEGFPHSRGGEDERHFDDCEFNGAASFIRSEYRAITQRSLAGNHPFDATDGFGNALHPVQDFYAHSNWVEMGFPRSDTVAQSDLVDLSGAQSSLGQDWYAPPGGALVRRLGTPGTPASVSDILLGADDWAIPAGWSIERNGAGLFLPTLVDPQGTTRGRLLETGKGFADHECSVPVLQGGSLSVAYTGIKHANLNKDGPTDDPVRRVKYERARALAILQTGHEWCRLVRASATGSQGARDGLLLSTWVRPGANPHPRDTVCAAAPPGPTPVVVDIVSVQVRDARESGSDPGEIQIAAALYDSPFSFHRSVHVTNRSGRNMELRDGERVPARELPRPLTLCVGEGQGATFALHAWDNDPGDDAYGNDFDDKGDDDDDLLVGGGRRFGAQLPTGTQTIESDYLRIRYRVSRGAVPTSPCPSR